MARGGPSRPPPRQQSKDYNAKQAQARKQRKQNGAAGGPSNIHDVFEYVTNQEEAKKNTGSRSEKKDNRAKRRAEVNDAEVEEQRYHARNRLNEDEVSSDDEGEDDLKRFRQTAPNYADGEEGGQDGIVRSEDDEEIDSDEAFGESDEEKFQGWKFGSRAGNRRSVGRGGAQNRDNDDQSSEEEEDDEDEDDDEDDDDLMDLSKMLEGTESEDDTDASSVDDDRLREKMESIGSKVGTKRQVESDEDTSAPKQKRRVLKERSEAISEGQYNIPTNAAGGASLLTIEDLLDPLKEQSGTAFTSIRNTAKVLKKRDDSKQAVASKKGGGALDAPLPSILQDRIDRSAAYEETKEEVQGWQETIKKIREAEHLSFPLQPDPIIKPSTSLMTSQFKASNSFEKQVAAMLEREGLSEKKLAEMEELKMNERGMSAEEIQERRNELRRMRDLIFREEQKAKRISKIKSKTYRKIARKQRDRDLEKAKAAGITLEKQEDFDDDDEVEKAARLRAKERATLKHKNTGKWAKNMIGLQGSKEMPEARNAIEEQLRKGEQLRRRIQGENSDEDISEAEEEEDVSGSEADDEATAFDELRAVNKKNQDERAKDEAGMQGKKGVWSMEFMKKARDQKARQTQEEIDQLERDIEEMEQSDHESEQDESNDEKIEILRKGSAPGRMIFNTNMSISDKRAQDNEEEEEEEMDSAVPSRSNKIASSTPSESLVIRDVPKKADNEEGVANPWLSSKPITKLSRKKNETTVSKKGSAISKAGNKISKRVAKGEAERRRAEEDAHLEIDPEARIGFQNKQPRIDKVAKGKDDDDDESDSDSSIEEAIAIRGRGPAAIAQRDLVAEAFAGDDVTAEFAAEKKAIMEADAPQMIDTLLPGWGTWGGKGIRVNKKRVEEQKKKFAKVIPGLDPTKRKDVNMSNVIINQKKDKKADKYRGKDVPYPYTSRAQYEMAMRNPLGPEWNTRTQHQKLTLPRIVTKPGKAIKPIERLF